MTVSPSAPAALSPRAAADELSMSLRTFQRRVQPRLKVLRIGGLVRIPREEITKLWLPRGRTDA